MRNITCFITFSFFTCFAFAGGGEYEYAVFRISPEMLKYADVIKRTEKISFEIINTGEAILKKKYALTIMNENGDRHAGFSEYYDKLHEIRNIEGALFDANGKELKRLKNKQIIDATGSDDGLADDNRVKFHHFYHRVYPYTVEYEVEIKYNGTLFFPMWIPREDDRYSVVESSITILGPSDYDFRHKALNFKGTSMPVTAGKNQKGQNWQVTNLAAIEQEYASPGWFDINPVLLFGPTAFEIQKYKGNMESWQDFGKFVYSLKHGRDELPATVKQKVHQLADPVSSVEDKIKTLYDYMQRNTRYISIQLGIGGWQPFDANFVAAKAYGDCKALTNYMYSLLKEAGIPSFYTLIRAGRDASEIVYDFPSQQFNHVILCVPVKKDTMWLECTSQTAPAGYLGDFTSNRYALLIDESGGTLVRTPSYSMLNNLQLRNIKGVLAADGALELQVSTNYSGLQQDGIHQLINNLSKEKVKEQLHDNLDFATFDINSFQYTEEKTALPTIHESLGIRVVNYATISGKRLFIIPNVMTRNSRRLSIDSTRKYDIVFDIAYKDEDSVEIQLPEGYSAESIPQPTSVQNKFGRYFSEVKLTGSKLFYHRIIERYAGTFPAKEYPELVNFYSATYKADRSKVVMVKNETTKGF